MCKIDPNVIHFFTYTKNNLIFVYYVYVIESLIDLLWDHDREVI